MLNDEGNNRMIILSGEEGNGKEEIAKYAVKYCSNRGYFGDGAHEIEIGSRKNVQGFKD